MYNIVEFFMKQMLKEEINDILADGRERVKKRQIKRLERKNYDVWLGFFWLLQLFGLYIMVI